MAREKSSEATTNTPSAFVPQARPTYRKHKKYVNLVRKVCFVDWRRGSSFLAKLLSEASRGRFRKVVPQEQKEKEHIYMIVFGVLEPLRAEIVVVGFKFRHECFKNSSRRDTSRPGGICG